ncbi:MAG TPA: ATP-binding protein [Terriglobales bacterium]|nr:ATP-binding protein [Terriglobales bacterium]
MKSDFFDVPLSCFSPDRKEQGKCWLNLLASGEKLEVCFPPDERLGNCLECSFFQKLSSRFAGRRSADRIAEESLKILLGQVKTFDNYLERINQDLNKKLEELSLLKKVSDALLKSQELDKTLRIILTGVTAGEAFGFNRAFIFLVNPKTQTLEGKMGLGPKDQEEAFKIWSYIKREKVTFDQMLENVLDSDEQENELTSRIKTLSFSLEDKDNVLVKSMLEKKSFNLKEEEVSNLKPDEVLKILSTKGFLLVPIFSENKAIGVLAVDNLITGNKIFEDDQVGLETFANQAASQIENIILHEELKQKIKELELASQILRENQNYLLQAERWVDIGKLATTVAHEIKTPLVTMGGYARRALRKAEQGKLGPHELEIIVKETERLESITSEILDYSKATKLNYEKKDLNLLIKEAIEVFKGKLRYNGIWLKTKFSPEPPILNFDPKRIKQVLFNLIENAVEAMPEGGALTIKTQRNEEFAIFEVEDTGSGIKEENLQKLWIPFFTTKPKGSGLGLSVCKKIIADHQGYIEVKSEAEKGSKFIVYLPFLRES